MSNNDELSYLRTMAREQDLKLKAYKDFEKEMDKIGVMLIDPLNKRSIIVDFFLKSKRDLNLKIK
ncbi:hypothetical protein [Runella limosa]|uniref:hypothetical protein n=1 Tax=Runella limosa TaxID=370978 RepID=UPI0004144478|nr:hypothetical protein [Runella limosa]